jgi:hypothetical protein
MFNMYFRVMHNTRVTLMYTVEDDSGMCYGVDWTLVEQGYHDATWATEETQC